MSELQQNRYDQLLRRVADLKGPGSKVNDVLGELFPTIDVENVPPELLLLMGTRMAVGRSNIGAGGAGIFNQTMLRNAAGSGMIFTIHEIRAGSTGAQVIAFRPTLNTLANVTAQAFVDLRAFPASPTGQVREEGLLVIGPNFFDARIAAEEVVWRPPRGIAVVTPGTAFSCSCTSANTNLSTGWVWTERVAQPSELNL